MKRSRTGQVTGLEHGLTERFSVMSRRILSEASRGAPRLDFVRGVVALFAEFSGADEVELRVNEGQRYYRGWLRSGGGDRFGFVIGPRASEEEGEIAPAELDPPGLARLCLTVLRGYTDPKLTYFTPGGSFWTGNTSLPVLIRERTDKKPEEVVIGGSYPSLIVIRFAVDEGSHGLLLLRSERPSFFGRSDVEFYEAVAQTIGPALADRRAQAALRERVKELTCLYGIDRVLERPNITLEQAVQEIAKLLPPAWLYPEIASARIVLDNREYLTPGFRAGPHRQSSEIVVRGVRRGIVEVVYSEPRPDLDEGPFLREERHLIDTVANRLSSVLEHRQTEEERQRLEEQLRHADRLATIGQLAAGVAHELNEPLSNVLGFAQLVQKTPGVPEPALRDIGKVVAAALHAREVVSKLMLFARQKPPAKSRVNLNELVAEGLYFLEARCQRAGIRLVRKLAADLPVIVADPGQLHQVLVNLVVNAIQAMPHGGELVIETRRENGRVVMVVSDTGIGMTREVLSQIFVPFFTTKGVGEGTGLGLSVVHGIVAGHAGSIEVKSEPGKGSRFEVRLPVTGAGNSQND
ncbi:MAG: ATP-binding protein [candidate division WOR-3 bacterium]